jgi:hypothetical protein
MAFLWVTRDPPGNWGWSTYFEDPSYITDGTVAIGCSLLLLILPKETPWWVTYATACLRRITGDGERLHATFGASNVRSESLIGFSVRSMRGGVEDGLHRMRREPLSVHDDTDGDASEIVVIASKAASSAGSAPSTPSSLSDLLPSQNATNPIEVPAGPATIEITQSSSTHDTAHVVHPPAAEHASPVATEEKLLPWTAVHDVSWDIIFLLGGGFALSRGFQDSGLSGWLTAIVVSEGAYTLSTLIIIACITSVIATNVMSNVAVANIMLPTLVCVGPSFQKDPLVVLAPVTLAISLALLFPIGTPPNAIALTNGNVSFRQMFFLGAFLTVIYLVMLIAYVHYLLPVLYHNPSDPLSEAVLNACNM